MIELRFQRYRLFPYERVLAMRELMSFGLEIVSTSASAVVAKGHADPAKLARLTYFGEAAWGGTRIEPDLAAIERRHLTRTGASRSRQATRYLVHGLHEYKGKFHPQVVRAFANLLDVGPGELILDPFCGSGTTISEALLMGCDAIGVDLSPLAVRVSQAKLGALTHTRPSQLAGCLAEWVSGTVSAMQVAERERAGQTIDAIGDRANAYLRAWYTEDTFSAVAEAANSLASLRGDPPLYLLASVVLSSILRPSSLQAPEDLRVRRRRSGESIPPAAELLASAGGAAVAAIQELDGLAEPVRRGDVVVGDVTTEGLVRSLTTTGQRTTVITSPPYATALPYIDTDRLSLVALGLVPVPELRLLEEELIGSREWRRAEHIRWDARLHSNSDRLPDSITHTCEAIQANSQDAGFRRRAVPGLLYRYFTQMADAFLQIRSALSAGERAVFIVGVNRTGRGDDEVVIDTPNLLADLASARSFRLDEVLPLDTWPRYGLHHGNGVRGESAVIVTAV